MEFALEVRPPAGEAALIPLAPQGSITMGRDAPAQFVIPDNFLSRSHLEFRSGNFKVEVIDTGSTNGMYVNGVRLLRSVLKHGDAVFAGKTVIRLTAVVDGKPLIKKAPSGPLQLNPSQKFLVEMLEGQNNFALLDGAIDPAVRETLNLTGVFYQSLYEGEQSAELAPVGPFLVKLEKPGQLVPHLIKNGWGKAWCTFAKAEMTFEEMRKHLRHFLTVQKQDGERMLFRFYDPRVLRTFLPTCVPEQCKAFFGAVESFTVESEGKDGVLRFTADSGKGTEIKLPG